jgi:iron complex outermembrane recepter protein
MRSIHGALAAILRHRPVMAWQALICTAGLLLTAPAMAIADSAQFNIAAQPLPAALKAFAAQSHMQLLYKYSAVAGATGNAVIGEQDKHAALEQLLRNTGLEVVYSGENAATIRPVKASNFKQTPESSSGGPDVASQSAEQVRLAQVSPGTPSTIPPADQAAQQKSIELQEVVVTAQKRTERLQDVPLSLTAVTGEEIARKDVTSLTGLQYSIPGLTIDEVAPGQDAIQIGGVSDADGPATVGVYLDEMPITGNTVQIGSTGTLADVRLLDMARVEVLRGPQGTLYGEGSMGGTIRYITNSPDLTTYSGSVEGEGGQIDGGAQSYKADGVANLPLIPGELGLRLVAGYERDGGWIDDSATGQSNINGIDFKTFRGKLLVRPTDRVEVSLLYQHQDSDQNFEPFGINGIYPSPVESFAHDRYDIVNGIVKFDLGPVDILETAGYLNRTSTSQADATAAFLPFLEAPPPLGLGLPSGFITGIPFFEQTTQRIYTDELRFSSNGNGPFTWIVGAYYRHGTAQLDESTSTFPGQLPFVLVQGTIPHSSNSAAVFADGTYQLTSHLSASIGGRYYTDREHLTSNTVEFGVPTLATPPGATFDSFDPKFNLTWKFSPDSMAYLNAAKGFRSGGFNATPVPGVPEKFSPDELWHYELGTKHELFDRKLDLAADVFYTDWSNVQTTVLLPLQEIAVTENAGKVNGWGTDLAVTARPADGLSLTGTMGWNNLAYATGTTSAFVNPGDPVDYAVRLSYSVSLDYRRTVFGDTVGFFRVDFQHAGPAQVTERIEDLIVHIPEHKLTNLRFGLDFKRFEASIFATNLFNDRSVIYPMTPSFAFNEEQMPRTIGVNIKAHF